MIHFYTNSYHCAKLNVYTGQTTWGGGIKSDKYLAIEYHNSVVEVMVLECSFSTVQLRQSRPTSVHNMYQRHSIKYSFLCYCVPGAVLSVALDEL